MPSQVLFSVSEDGADELRLDIAARQLTTTLRDTGLRDAAPYSSGEAPPGSKAGAAMVAGAVLATVGGLPLSSVLAHVVQWLRSGLSKRTVRVEINGDVLVLDGVNDETQQQLMREWLDRHPVDAAQST